MKKNAFCGMLRCYISKIAGMWLIIPGFFLISQIVQLIVHCLSYPVNGVEVTLPIASMDVLAAVISLWVGSLCSIRFYNIAAACGVSRRTSAYAQITAYLVSSLVMMNESVFITRLHALINPESNNKLMLIEYLYGSLEYWSKSDFQRFAFVFTAILTCTLLGYLFGSVFCRITVQKAAWLFLAITLIILGISAGVCISWLLDGVDPDMVFGSVFQIFLRIMGIGRTINIMQGIMVLVCASVLTAILGIVVSRHAPAAEGKV